MSQRQDLTVVENNDVVFTLNLTYNSAPFNLTGYTVDLVLKASETATDGSGITFTTGSGLTVTSTQFGQVQWTFPHADDATPGTQWWRIDAIDGSGDRTTFIMGNFTIQAA